MKKSIGIIVITTICILNLLGVVFFLNQNKNSILEVSKNTQQKELYTLSNNVSFIDSDEDFVSYIKSLKVSSNQNWYIYDLKNNCFLLYKDKEPQFLDEKVRDYFINFKNSYESYTFKDSNNDEMLLTIINVEIKDNKYLLGTSEYTQGIYTSVYNNNFNIYILGESIIFSVLSVILAISISLKSLTTEKEIKKITKQFDDYKKRFSSETNTENYVETQSTLALNDISQKEEVEIPDTSVPIKDADGNYTIELLNQLLPNLKENNINFTLHKITGDKFWIIEDCFKDNFYKIKKNDKDLIILLIDGTEKQKMLLEEFGEIFKYN